MICTAHGDLLSCYSTRNTERIDRPKQSQRLPDEDGEELVSRHTLQARDRIVIQTAPPPVPLQAKKWVGWYPEASERLNTRLEALCISLGDLLGSAARRVNYSTNPLPKLSMTMQAKRDSAG